MIANRQLDVWEIAYVWAWPIDLEHINALEAHLFHESNAQSPLMNGTVPPHPGKLTFPIPEKRQRRVLSDEDSALRRKAAYRLPRQAQHYKRPLYHILTVQDSHDLRRSLQAHFERLKLYHEQFSEPLDG